MAVAVTYPSFTSGSTISSTQVAQNFADLVNYINGANVASGNLAASSVGASGANDLSSHIVDGTTLQLSGNQLSLTAAVQALLNPPGFIQPYGGASAPTGWLLCDGTSYLRATYPALFTAIGTAYGTADGSHFNVPDLRGRFLRGADKGAGNDPDASSRIAITTGGATADNVGSLQADAVQGHYHTFGSDTLGNPLYVAATGAATGSGGLLSSTPGDPLKARTLLTDGSNGAPRVTSETRPKNVNVTYLIKT